MKRRQNALHFCLRVVVGLIALTLISFTTAPLIRTDVWWIRIFDFPRLQIAFLIGLTLASYIALHLWQRLRPWEYALTAVTLLALIWQLVAIAPYTMFYSKEMSDSHNQENTGRISLLIYNVLYENRNVQALLALINDTNPDLILLSEPSQWWLEQLHELQADYPYTLQQPQDNRYGMLLYSRLELINPEIRFLVESEIPSLRSQMRLRSGKLITFYGMHPRPPGLKLPQEEVAEGHGDKRADSDMRDAELMLVAKEIKKTGNAPVIVAGDFNDVAWSHTTHLFQRMAGLLDPRIGRGLLNTFDTGNRFFRYPLDHAFASEHFLLVELRRLPDIGSDHFPLLVVLDYAPETSGSNDEPKPDQGDKKEAEKAIDKGKSIE